MTFFGFIQLYTINDGNYDIMKASFYKDKLDSFIYWAILSYLLIAGSLIKASLGLQWRNSNGVSAH